MRIIAVLTILIFQAPVNSQDIPYRIGNKWGIADTNQNFIIYPKYDYISEIQDDVFRAHEENHKYLLNRLGKSLLEEDMMIKQAYRLDTVNDEITIEKGKSEELLIVFEKSEKEGLLLLKDYLNPKIEIKLEPIYNEILLIAKKVLTFDGDRNLVEYEINDDFKINKTKEDTSDDSPFEDMSSEDEENDLKPINNYMLSLDNRYQPTTLISSYSNRSFSIGDSISDIYKSAHLLYHSDDRRDIPYKNDFCYLPKENAYIKNSAIVQNHSNKYGLVNAKGEVVIPLIYQEIYDKILQNECNELFILCKKENKWGIVSYKHEIVIPFLYESILVRNNISRTTKGMCFSFNGGLVVQKKEKYALINQHNQQISPYYDTNKTSFQSKLGLTIIRVNDRFGVCDGIHFIPPIFQNKPSGISIIDGFPMVRFNFDNGKVQGYANSNGDEFFISKACSEK